MLEHAIEYIRGYKNCLPVSVIVAKLTKDEMEFICNACAKIDYETWPSLEKRKIILLNAILKTGKITFTVLDRSRLTRYAKREFLKHGLIRLDAIRDDLIKFEECMRPRSYL